MDNLLTKCNADVYKAILDIKDKNHEIGEHLIAVLQKHEYWLDMNGLEILHYAARLPHEIWDGKIHTFHLLFQSKQTTTMP